MDDRTMTLRVTVGGQTDDPPAEDLPTGYCFFVEAAQAAYTEVYTGLGRYLHRWFDPDWAAQHLLGIVEDVELGPDLGPNTDIVLVAYLEHEDGRFWMAWQSGASTRSATTRSTPPTTRSTPATRRRWSRATGSTTG